MLFEYHELMLIFVSVFAILGVFCIDQTTVLKFQFNIDHSLMYDIVNVVNELE